MLACIKLSRKRRYLQTCSRLRYLRAALAIADHLGCGTGAMVQRWSMVQLLSTLTCLDYCRRAAEAAAAARSATITGSGLGSLASCGAQASATASSLTCQ